MNGIFKIFKSVDGILKLVQTSVSKRNGKSQNYLAHAWVSDDRVMVGTDAGELVLVEAAENRSYVTQETNDNHSIDAIIATQKGFICAGENGMISLFDRTEDQFKPNKSFSITNENIKIKNLALSPSEETLACTLENNQLVVLALSTAELLKSDQQLDMLSLNFHADAITGIDTCIRKPLIATCGLDRTVRIWNYVDRTLELEKPFAEEAYSIAFHPSGLFILVGFSDKLRLMNLLMDDIEQFKEITIRGCKECKFSNGGQYFAAVNSNTIQVFNTWTFENIGNMRGHTGKVRSLQWSKDDTMLISAGAEGFVYEWDVSDFKRGNENVKKKCIYTSLALNGEGPNRTVYAVGSDKKLREIRDNMATADEPDIPGSAVTQLAMPSSGRMILCGTEDGFIRAVKLPATNTSLSEAVEVQCHTGPVTRMAVSHDDNYLFSVGEDGSLFVLDIKEKDTRTLSSRKEKDVGFANEVLVTKSDLEDKDTIMNELRSKVEELTSHGEYQIRMKELNHTEFIKDMRDNHMHQLEQEKRKFEMLSAEKNEAEKEYEAKLKQQYEKFQMQLRELEASYHEKFLSYATRYEKLSEEKKAANDQWDARMQLLIENNEQVIQDLTEDYDQKQNEDQAIMKELKLEMADLIREFEETKRQLEEDADREIEDMKHKKDEQLATMRADTLRLKGENAILKKKFLHLEKDIEEQQEQIRFFFNQNRDFFQKLKTKETEITGLKNEIYVRNGTISDKERRIFELKRKNQELEKFKFVLDYKIKELKKQLEPKDRDIKKMKEQIRNMDTELEEYSKKNMNQELALSELRLKVEGLNKEISKQRAMIKEGESYKRSFQVELYKTVQLIKEPKELKKSVLHLNKLFKGDNVDSGGLDADIQKEYNRQRAYLEKSVAQLKAKLKRDSDMHKKDNQRIMQENVALIKEINNLRRELKQMKQAQVQKSKLEVGNKMKRFGSSDNLNHISSTSSSTMLPPEIVRMIEVQKQEIASLKEQLDSGSSSGKKRPMSREKLPPMEGFESQ
eukprot:TRINITY_DN1634_c0_g1_i5.p1 TRINITY_DN1634_c0_g1~~TRINITY_DN1634_c0_g1_i5.p1  ORF type:complete len:1021 (+),score=468.18 TRINITY_DN1634_c0_g1_i5:488-3550(+)